MFSAFARQFVSMFIRAFLGTARYGRIPEHPRGYLRATGYGLGGHGRIPRVQGTVCVCVCVRHQTRSRSRNHCCCCTQTEPTVGYYNHVLEIPQSSPCNPPDCNRHNT